ncbi:MAG: solute:sodium symporter family transporter [Chloroherpetonaceae bacterium]|nr:solute:sodium symporter family transporter [Chloroherpetonaceae bacterium]
MQLSTLDYFVFGFYFLVIIGAGLAVLKFKKNENSEDYFLAGRSLPWWVIGSSLIASNISAEQFIGMSGSGFASGLAIASYEWLAAVTLLIVGKYFLPIFLEKKIYTMPEFLELRFDHTVRTGLAGFWLMVYVFVNLTSVMYLGALTMQTVLGIDLMMGIIGLALLSALYTIYGGLAIAAWTDAIQVVFLVSGGLLITLIGLNTLGDGSIIFGFGKLLESAPEKFHMVLEANHPELPWIGVFIGGMWMANIGYWGCNQYITQRTLAAKSLKEAQKGIILAAVLKIIMPLIVVLPGIIAFALYGNTIAKPDEAFPTLVKNLAPSGAVGLIFAALIAAIVSSLNSMTNSAATLFTIDIYKSNFKKDASEKELVWIGRVVSASVLLIAIVMAPQLKNLSQAFQFIQEYTGFVTPGVVVIFLFGLFWKKATSSSARWAALLTIPLSLGFKILFPELAFLNRMGIVFLALAIVIVMITLLEKRGNDEKAIRINPQTFNTDGVFNISALLVLGVIGALYLYFW